MYNLIWPNLPLHHSAHPFMHPRQGSFGFIWVFTSSLTDFSLGTYYIVMGRALKVRARAGPGPGSGFESRARAGPGLGPSVNSGPRALTGLEILVCTAVKKLQFSSPSPKVGLLACSGLGPSPKVGLWAFQKTRARAGLGLVPDPSLVPKRSQGISLYVQQSSNSVQIQRCVV